MMRLHLLLAIALLALCDTPDASGALQVSANGRYLVDMEGRPFLVTGDSAWSLFGEPTMAEIELYLQDRAARGFNFIAASLLEHKFSTNPPLNAEGEPPFTGAPFITPNEAYFARADSILQLADALDIVILLAPVYLGWVCSDQGWCSEVQSASLQDMREWGRFLGARYQDQENILWSIGGDTDPTIVADKLREFVAGVREFDTTHLMTAHNQRGTQAITPWPNESWLEVNNVFSVRQALYQNTLAAWENPVVRPFIMLEGFYENEHQSTAQQLRAQSYWTVLTGGFGTVFGNCPLWHFGYSTSWCGSTDWQSQLGAAGSVQMTHYRALFESRHWQLLVPDVDHQVLTSGYGSWGAEDYSTAAATSDGSSIIVYQPGAGAAEFDTSVLSGDSVRVWSFNPADGAATWLADHASGPVSLPPGPGTDRVLVLDDLDRAFGPPGSPLATSTPPALGPRIRMEQNRPNPFNPSTEIRLDLAERRPVQVTIHDSAGRLVRHLFSGAAGPGPHTLSWDGRDGTGGVVGSGIYYCRLVSGASRLSLKMTLLK